MYYYDWLTNNGRNKPRKHFETGSLRGALRYPQLEGFLNFNWYNWSRWPIQHCPYSVGGCTCIYGLTTVLRVDFLTKINYTLGILYDGSRSWSYGVPRRLIRWQGTRRICMWMRILFLVWSIHFLTVYCLLNLDHEEALFNPNCRILHLLEDIRRRCNCPENGLFSDYWLTNAKRVRVWTVFFSI